MPHSERDHAVTIETTPPPARSAGRIQGLDMLRGVAILLVLLRHALPQVFGGAGIVGVVIFFTLSGYLITSVLLKDIATNGRVRYRKFYRSRILRLVPALMFMLLGVVVVTLVFDPLNDRAELVRTVIVGMTYTADLPFDHGSESLGHLWTLAVEEQFYLVWPLLLTIGFRRSRLGTVLAVAGAVIYLAMCATLAIYAPHFGDVYILPSSWSVAMVIGAAARVFQTRIDELLPASGSRAVLSVAVAGVGLLAISLVPDLKERAIAYLVLGVVIAAATVVLMHHVKRWKVVPTRFLRPLVWLGTISYAVYLWNYPIVLWLGQIDSTPLRVGGALGLTLLAGVVSWFLVEAPFLRLKRGRVVMGAQSRP